MAQSGQCNGLQRSPQRRPMITGCCIQLHQWRPNMASSHGRHCTSFRHLSRTAGQAGSRPAVPPPLTSSSLDHQQTDLRPGQLSEQGWHQSPGTHCRHSSRILLHNPTVQSLSTTPSCVVVTCVLISKACEYTSILPRPPDLPQIITTYSYMPSQVLPAARWLPGWPTPRPTPRPLGQQPLPQPMVAG